MSKKYVSKELSEQIHKKADPFIKWLKEAEEETSEEDEDEVELEFDDRANISALQVQLHTRSIAIYNFGCNGVTHQVGSSIGLTSIWDVQLSLLGSK